VRISAAADEMATPRVSVTNSTVLLSSDTSNSLVQESYYNLSQTSSGFSSLGPSDGGGGGHQGISGPSSLVRGRQRRASRRLSQVIFRTKCAEKEEAEAVSHVQLERKESSVYVAASRLFLQGDDVSRSDSPLDTSSGSATLIPAAASFAYSDATSSSASTYSSAGHRTIVTIGESRQPSLNSPNKTYETEEVSLWLEDDEEDTDDAFDDGVVVWRCSGTGPKRRTWVLKRRRRRSETERMRGRTWAFRVTRSRGSCWLLVALSRSFPLSLPLSFAGLCGFCSASLYGSIPPHPLLVCVGSSSAHTSKEVVQAPVIP
jgi:hypothetical protein